MKNNAIKVGKFGGSSLSSAEHIQRCAQIASSQNYTIVVVSAIGKTTRRLVDIFDAARAGCIRDVREKMALLAAQHRTISMELTRKGSLLSQVEGVLAEAQKFIEGLQTPDAASQDAFLSFGERFSTALFRCAAPERGHRDARQLIRTDEQFGRAQPLEVTVEGLEPFVTEGFIGSSASGRITTLGFEGSDLTASLLASALHAERVDIWTDVRGVFAVDPHLVPDAPFYATLSYDQMALLASLGGRVLHERTLEPLKSSSIPLVVRTSFAPQMEGTVIQRVPNPTFWALSRTNDEVHVINRTKDQVQAALRSHGWKEALKEHHSLGQTVVSFQGPLKDKDAFMESLYQELKGYFYA